MLKLLLGAWLGVAPQSTSSIEGTVKRGGLSEPLGGVEISLLATTGPARFRTISDPQGQFLFENVPLGQYRVQAARDGYFSYPQGQALPAMVATLKIDSAQTQQLVINLVPGAVIGGLITDPAGKPLPGVAVSAMKLQYDEGRPAFGVGPLPKTTNDRGEYRLFWFPPGEYYIRAEYPNGPNNLAGRAYYPGTMNSTLAVPVTIRGGESLDGLNFAIPTANAIRISGHIADEGAVPATGVRTFYLLPRDGGPVEVYPPEFSNALNPLAGEQLSEFLLNVRGVSPGSYDLAPFFIDRSNTFHSGRTTIQIGEDNLENVIARIHPNVDVTGRFVIEGSSPLRSWNALHLQLRAKDIAAPLTQRSNTATIASDGMFTIRGVIEGVYQVHITASAGSISSGLYISSMKLGALDIRNEGTIDVRASMLPLEIRLSPGAGSIRGAVEAPGGRVSPNADVVLVPQFSRRENVMFYDRTRSDDKGQFTFQGIAPGEYKVFAFEQLPDTAERNPAFMARYETLGQTVDVNSSATAEIRIRLLP